MTARKRKPKSEPPEGERIYGRIGEDSPLDDWPADDAGDDTPYLTLAEAARYLKIGSHVTLRRLVREENLPIVDFGPRMIRTKREWIDEWVRRRAEGQEHGGA